MDESKLLVIEEVLKRMEQSNSTALGSIQGSLQDVKEGFQAHLILSAAQDEKFRVVEAQTFLHKDALFGDRGVVKRVEAIEGTISTVQKALWEIAKPALALLGVMLVVMLGIFGAITYGLFAIIQKIP